ncbi:MAG: efflux RND transporter periplasmic adaptor subunit [Deltaproteobacteria bacterium]|nr:efflux RND transporter periplasmic adaptor subunit [Deltaproteobacteria bacterium]
MARWKRIALPVGVVLAAVLIAVAMVEFKPSATRAALQRPAPNVEILVADPKPAVVRVPATGVVKPSQQVGVIPEITGKVVHQSKNLVPGGLLKKGEVMIRVDARDYLLAAKQEESRVRQAELDLELERGRVEVARKEWELLGDDRPEDQAGLALRRPQLETVRQNLESARSALEKAQLNLSRTVIRAPFNALVASESVDVGQVIAPGREIAVIAGIDRFWVEASIPVERLADIDVPRPGFDGSSAVVVKHELDAGRAIEREGQVLGLAGGLDPQTRTARILVGVDDPLNPPDGKLPLLPGAFVTLDIFGHEVPGAVEVPRSALVDGSRVWIADAEDKLASRDVRVAWGTDHDVFITDGLDAGDRVVLTRLGMPIDGMPVQPQLPGEEKPDAAEAHESSDQESGA